ncbi:MAG: AraC family ligand binding domain-containing protein [Chitinophagaceae bacterium]
MKDIPIRKIKTPQKELNISESISIRQVQDLLNGKDLTHELHRHDFFFMLALQKGKGIHEIDFIKYEVYDHSMFILRPGQVHKLNLHRDCTGFLMEFAPTFYQPNDKVSIQRLSRATKKSFCEVEAARHNKLLSLLSYIFNEFTVKQEGYIEVIKANLDIFFIEFIRQSSNPHDTSKKGSTYIQERFEEFMELTSTHVTTFI